MQLPKFSFSNVINGLLLSTLISIVLLIGCHADEYPESVPTKVTVTGTIIDADTQTPLEGASIRSDNNAVTVVTKANGLFLLEDVGVNKIGEVIITFAKEGYASNQKVFVVEHGKTYSTRLEMKAYGDIQEQGSTTPLINEVPIPDPRVPVTIEIPNPLDAVNPMAVFVLPADSLGYGTDEDPLTYTVKATVLDPTDLDPNKAERKFFPGFFLTAPFDFFRPDALLESVVFVHVSITDNKGAQVTSFLKPVQYYLLLPSAYQTGGEKEDTYADGSSIQWWSFRNTRGHWGQEAADASIKIPNDIVGYETITQLYVAADVSQLTWFNAGSDIKPLSCLGVNVVDQNATPVSGAVVSAQGKTYFGNSLPVITNENGFAQLLVKPSADVNNLESVEVYLNQGAVSIQLDVLPGTGDGDDALDEVYTSTTANSFIVKNGVEYGDCKNLNSKLVVDLSRTVFGQVTYLGSGTSVANHPVHTDIGISVESNESGAFTMRAPVIPESFYVFSSVEFPITPDFTISNDFQVLPPLIVQTPVIDTLTRSVGGTVVEGTDVTLTVTAKDLEDPSRTLIYSWTTDVGSFVDASLATVVWTAPMGTGTANLNVLVDNGSGGTINQTLVIEYAPAP